VSDFDDDVYEMPTPTPIDDATAEAVFRGDPVGPEFDVLVDVLGAMRAAAEQPVHPSPRLAAFMAAGGATHAAAVAGDVEPSPSSRKLSHPLRTGVSRFAGLRTRTKVAVGLAAAFTGLTGVTAAGALPDAAQDRVETIVEAVTPITFDDSADFGQEVADDARDGGVDGDEISDLAHEQGQDRDLPDQSQADEHKPTITPGEKPTDLPTPDATPPVTPGDEDHPEGEAPDDVPADAPVDPEDPPSGKDDAPRP
jgi:hypothetical protein